METVRQRGKDGKMIETERPLIPGVVFFRCDGSEVSVIRELLTDKAFIYHRQGRDKREPAPISDRELDNFRRFVDYSDHYERIDNQTVNLSKGQQVHVTEGPYKGFEGTVCRVKGNRHLVIAVTGVCAVMLIDYVPQAFLQKMEQQFYVGLLFQRDRCNDRGLQIHVQCLAASYQGQLCQVSNVPYYCEDNNDYVDGEGLGCNKGSWETVQAKGMAVDDAKAKSVSGNFMENLNR